MNAPAPGQRPWARFYPEGTGADLQVPPETIPERFDRQVALLGSEAARRPLVEFFGARFSFARIQEESRLLAAALHRLGVARGDRVAVMLPNSPQYVVAYLGVLRLGAVVVQVNPLYTPRELAFLLEDSGARALVVLDQMLPTLERARREQELRHLETVVYTRIREYLPPLLALLQPLQARRQRQWVPAPRGAGHHNLSHLIRQARRQGWQAPQGPVDPQETVACLQYTGGTTGTPKGAMLTHANLVVNVEQLAGVAGAELFRGYHRVLAVLPFFHSYGLTTCLNFALFHGHTLIALPRFRLEEVLRTIHRGRPTHFPGVPTMYIAILNAPESARYDLSSLQMMNSGAAPLPVEVMRRFEQRSGGRIVEGYGLSEASPFVSGNPVHRSKPGTVGIPAPGTLCRIVDLETGERELPPGETGELVVKGPQVMKGYWNRPEETAATIRDGWLYTGDVARMDEDGYIAIVERKKDLILTGGFNVYPREVEEVLYQHPKVREAAVTGVPDPYAGERVKAFVVVKEGENLSEDELIAFCRERLAGYKVPRIVEFRDELPKSMVGKVLRRELRADSGGPRS
ncbi:long-chain-fatty-acid--CoA ligase [Limnochorda pilosa]|uniref:Long-chain-fatty-acid--CoA ligase n=1 Tax=Limnochorda pilosa TaxID=1555112 RepID=A0A0K2SGQ6_LIMPI|nr:long-chain fatty acid--CoA ligase [Limnochorda pilosa]BAS26024.1 long-chain fatty acid--CoA ligase [Limnochorda pilosa]